MTPSRRRFVLPLAAVLLLAAPSAVVAQAPAGDVTVSFHVTVTPAWLDPPPRRLRSRPSACSTRADALVRPRPGQKMGASLAESWTESPDGLVYEFRPAAAASSSITATRHAEDVTFSYDRYKARGAGVPGARAARGGGGPAAHPLPPQAGLARLMTFYGTPTPPRRARRPKKYVEQGGDEGFRQRRWGRAYRFVSHAPGVELVLEAYAGYWRHAPYVKRFVMKSITDSTSRLAALKSGGLDMAYFLDGPEAEVVKKDPRLVLVDTRHASIFWIEFADQWDSKSPWHDRRMRQAVNLSLDRKSINEAACVGFCPPAGVIVPRVMEFALQVEPPPYDLPRASSSSPSAGYPNGLDAGDFVPIPGFYTVAEATMNALNAAGIRVRSRLMERAPSTRRGRRRSCAGSSSPRWALRQCGQPRGAFIYSKGSHAMAAIRPHELFQQQARERDPASAKPSASNPAPHRRRVMFAPVMVSAD